jgi:hypothetical protein
MIMIVNDSKDAKIFVRQSKERCTMLLNSLKHGVFCYIVQDVKNFLKPNKYLIEGDDVRTNHHHASVKEKLCNT